MMNKNKWIILISVVVVVILAAVLLFVMLGGGTDSNINNDNNTPGTSDTAPTDTAPTQDDAGDPVVEDEDTEIKVEIDTGTEEFEDDMVIDFDDLLAAAGK